MPPGFVSSAMSLTATAEAVVEFPTVTELPTVTDAPTVTVTFSRAERLFASKATVTVFPTVTVAATELAITGWDKVTTDGVSVRLK